VNCQEKIEKLKTFDFVKPKKSLTSDFTQGTYFYLVIFYRLKVYRKHLRKRECIKQNVK